MKALTDEEIIQRVGRLNELRPLILTLERRETNDVLALLDEMCTILRHMRYAEVKILFNTESGTFSYKRMKKLEYAV